MSPNFVHYNRNVHGDPMNLIIPNLYLGSMFAGFNPLYLSNQGVQSVLQVCPSIPLNSQERNINRWVISLPDVPETQLLPYFQYTCSWIQHQLRNGNPVLVHCMAGVSRSATIIIAYLMWNYKWNLRQAFQYVQRRRRIINPNHGFISQLQKWQKILKIK